MYHRTRGMDRCALIAQGFGSAWEGLGWGVETLLHGTRGTFVVIIWGEGCVDADGLSCVCYITNPTNTHSGQSAAHTHQISALCPCRCKISRIARCLGHVVLPDREVGTGLEGFG